jgi:cytochrome c oxidase assembly factor CtaG
VFLIGMICVEYLLVLKGKERRTTGTYRVWLTTFAYWLLRFVCYVLVTAGAIGAHNHMVCD